jgi:hypothetical protein
VQAGELDLELGTDGRCRTSKTKQQLDYFNDKTIEQTQGQGGNRVPDADDARNDTRDLAGAGNSKDQSYREIALQRVGLGTLNGTCDCQELRCPSRLTNCWGQRTASHEDHP